MKTNRYYVVTARQSNGRVRAHQVRDDAGMPQRRVKHTDRWIADVRSKVLAQRFADFLNSTHKGD